MEVLISIEALHRLLSGGADFILLTSSESLSNTEIVLLAETTLGIAEIVAEALLQVFAEAILRKSGRFEHVLADGLGRLRQSVWIEAGNDIVNVII